MNPCGRRSFRGHLLSWISRHSRREEVCWPRNKQVVRDPGRIHCNQTLNTSPNKIALGQVNHTFSEDEVMTVTDSV